MDESELINIRGGSGLSATALNALVRAITTAYELGRTLGSLIRRSKSKNYCSM